MKRYIHSDTNKKAEYHYRIDVTLQCRADYRGVDVAATEEPRDLSMFPKELLEQPINKFASLVDSIRFLIKSRGFHELDVPHKSPDSDSEYYLFCLEDDYTKCLVEVFCYMRVSDHPLKQRFSDHTAEDAQQNWANNHLPDKVRQYNKEIDNLVFQYEYDKAAAKLMGKPFNASVPSDVVITVEYIQIDDVKHKTKGQALNDVADTLYQIRTDMEASTKLYREQRAEWLKKQKHDEVE